MEAPPPAEWQCLRCERIAVTEWRKTQPGDCWCCVPGCWYLPIFCDECSTRLSEPQQPLPVAIVHVEGGVKWRRWIRRFWNHMWHLRCLGCEECWSP